jgi:hypothetical protein
MSAYKFNNLFAIILCFVLFQIAWADDFPICNMEEVQWFPAAASDGTNYLVVWSDMRDFMNTGSDIYGAIVSPNGVVSPPNGFLISQASNNPAAPNNQEFPAVAFDGTNYLVVWLDYRNEPGRYDIYGARVSTNGTVLDHDGIQISIETRGYEVPYTFNSPGVAFDGINFFVTWVDQRDGYHAIYGARVTPAGQVSDPHGIPISAPGYGEGRPRLVFGLTKYLVCWMREDETQVSVALMTRSGVVTDQIGIPPRYLINGMPNVSFDGINFLVVWGDRNHLFDWEIWGRTVNEFGYSSPNFCIRPSPWPYKANNLPDIDFDGMTYLVVWEDGRNRQYQEDPDWDIYGRRVSTEKILVVPELPICSGLECEQSEPTVAFGRTNFLVAWRDERELPNVEYDIYGRLIEATLISKDATGPNQGRHLARAPNSLDLDWAYHTNIGTFWNWMGELITGRPTYLERGKYPTVAKNEPNAPWVAYTTGETLFGLVKQKNNSDNWKKALIKVDDSIFPPSHVLSATLATPEQGDLGYVVYTLKRSDEYHIYFAAFDSLDVYCNMLLEEGNVSEPSIALTPGDYLHVVWKKEGRIYYITTLDPVYPQSVRQGHEPVWSIIEQISRPWTEPASNPFVEAQGEWVHAVWRGPNEEGNPDYGEIWQRPGRIQPGNVPQWRDPVNKSRTPTQESNFPTMSTGNAIVWQESIPETHNNPTNYEIYANLQTEQGEQNVNISNTPTNSYFPHTNLMATYDPNNDEVWRLFSIWTEESIPQSFYRVKFDDYYFSGPDTNIWPLSVPVGDSSPSPYCLERDGFIQFNGMKIDYDSTSLAYILPYLNPRKYYLLEAIAYHESSGVYRQRFSFRNRNFEVRYRRSIPETLRVIIPPGFYDSTFINLRINRLQGNFASLAKLRLREFEIIREKEGGAQGELTVDIPLKTFLFSPFPNPFTNDLSIKYQLSKPGRVLLKVYSISGREVKILTNENKEPGTYTVNFDGRDTHGLGLPIGIYFIQLKTKDCSLSKKVILTR